MGDAQVDASVVMASETKSRTLINTIVKLNSKTLNLVAALIDKLQPVAKMLRHSHEKTTCLASDRC